MTNSIYRTLATFLFVLSLPVLIVTTNVKNLFLDPGFYYSNQVANGVSQTSGLPADTLQAADRSLTGYFASREATLDSQLKKQGLPTDFFQKRESDHLVDVKNLVWLVMGLQQTALGYVLLFLVANLLFWPRRFLQKVKGPLLWASGLTMAAVVVTSVASQVDFDQAFLLLHLVSFRNDFWMLDPSTDNLLKMLPQAFWVYSAIVLIAYCAIEALGLGIVGGILWYWHRPSAKKSG